MENPLVVAVVTIVIIALSAFFVAVEFALLAARRHRIEDEALTSRSARAALRSSSELTVLLAGSQLGITVCTLALGAITKPAVHHWLTPGFEALGLPFWVADVVGFVLALVIVTFLHLVVGEMAPKSWAIAHPERSAIMLALPMRGFMWATRPVLRALNEAANWCLRRVGVDPAEESGTTQDPDGLRHLVAHSVNVGALEASYSRQISGALSLEDLTLGDLVETGSDPVSVAPDATVAQVQEAGRASGHLRILVRAAADPAGTRPDQQPDQQPDQHSGQYAGQVHVRDTLVRPGGERVAGLVREVVELPAATSIHAALATMRGSRQHLALVRVDDRVGVVTLTDVMGRLFPSTESTRAGA